MSPFHCRAAVVTQAGFSRVIHAVLNASVILERNETRLVRNKKRLERNEVRLARHKKRLERNETRLARKRDERWSGRQPPSRFFFFFLPLSRFPVYASNTGYVHVVSLQAVWQEFMIYFTAVLQKKEPLEHCRYFWLGWPWFCLSESFPSLEYTSWCLQVYSTHFWSFSSSMCCSLLPLPFRSTPCCMILRWDSIYCTVTHSGLNFCSNFNNLTSVFHASALLLIMNLS